MVDVSPKAMTERVAIAEGRVLMQLETLDIVQSGNAKKGDVLGAARIAGIMAAKRTHELIPLCHPLALTQVEVDAVPDAKLPGVKVTARVKVSGKTGVEMEALTAVSVACLTIYDMVKAVERGMRIEGIRLVEKSGGKSGHFRAKDTMIVALLSVAGALEQILAQAEPLPADEVPLAEADGQVLAYDLKARRTQPPADVSAMDGYAVRAADVASAPVRLKVIGEVAAGRPFAAALGSGEAARIFTGGVLPQAADTVVIQEVTTRDGDIVEIQKPSALGRNVRPQGLDFRVGDRLLAKGHRLTPRDRRFAAGMNHPVVPVHRRPKLALFATGDELVPPGSFVLPSAKSWLAAPLAARPFLLVSPRTAKGCHRFLQA